jgi:hypothetical protein
VHVEAKKKVVAGMFARKSREPAQVDACVVLDPIIDGARRALETYLGGARGKGDAQIALGADRKPVIELRWWGEIPAETFGRIHHLPPDYLAAIMAGLRDRGLLDVEGHLTESGRATKDRIETLTDALAEAPYAALDAVEVDELVACLAPIASRLRETGSR